MTHRNAKRLLTLLGLCFAASAFPGAPALADGRIDVNTASEAELVTLSGIGPARARAIIEHRERHGPFTSVDALTDVSGIGPATLNRIRDHITVGDGRTAASDAPPPTEPARSQAPPVRQASDGDFDLDLTRETPPPSAADRQAALAARQGEPTARAPADSATRPSTPAGTDPTGRINVNTADEGTLTQLPGIGPARARAIIAHRSAAGPFRTLEQLTDVSGIGPATYRGLADLATVKVDLNTAGLAELEAIGLDQEAAERLIAWRASNGPFRSVDEITDVPGFGRGALETLRPFVWVAAP